MFRKAVLFSLLSLVLIASATGLECMIYVSSSDGINNTSCWTGGYQTPCATLDLALQGTLTVQDKCSSGTVINLSPGNYTLDTTTLLEQQLLRNNVSIIGMRNGSRYEEVNITCLHVSSSSYHWLGYIVFQCVSLYNCNNVPVSCTQPSFDLTTHNAISQEVCPNLTLNVEFVNLHLQCPSPPYYYYYYSDYCDCEYLQFTVSIIDNCNNKQYDWKNDLHACLYTEPSIYNGCYNLSIMSGRRNGNNYYELHNTCFNKTINDGPIEVLLYVQTLNYLININTNQSVNVTSECASSYQYYYNEKCHYSDQNNCDNMVKLKYYLPYYLPYYPPSSFNNYYYQYYDDNCGPCNNQCCYDNITTQKCIANCTSDSDAVPINILNKCFNCNQYHYPLGILVFILIEILPITLLVILIIILNIQLTNGSINVVVFYSQIIAIIYSLYNCPDINLTIIPCSIFNLDFTPLLYNYPLCIAPHMSPLGAISFWYVIGFYPLLLLLLIYVWIILYDKGFQCVVFITRPFHRCMARFWSMTGIEPSLTNSIASIYILSFTQLTATSFKILSFIHVNSTTIMGYKFYYNAKQGYFHGVHGFAGSFAILVLLIVILLPTLYIQFYPFKWFHKLLDCLHLRKQLLISLCDIFTGPYKNGSENTFDYRFMAGLYLLARIITLSPCVPEMSLFAISIALACCSFLLALIILIFRPFKRNIDNFSEVLIVIMILAVCIIILTDFMAFEAVLGIHCSVMFVFLIYVICQMLKACKHYWRKSQVTKRVQEDTEPLADNDDDWVADRMENPQEYNEQHVTDRLDEESEEHHQPIAITTAATYGSINNST